MIVQCPKCDTRFRLDEKRLGDRGAKVKCSICGHGFVVAKDSGPAEVTNVSSAPPIEPPPFASTKPPPPRAPAPSKPPAPAPAPAHAPPPSLPPAGMSGLLGDEATTSDEVRTADPFQMPSFDRPPAPKSAPVAAPPLAKGAAPRVATPPPRPPPAPAAPPSRPPPRAQPPAPQPGSSDDMGFGDVATMVEGNKGPLPIPTAEISVSNALLQQAMSLDSHSGAGTPTLAVVSQVGAALPAPVLAPAPPATNHAPPAPAFEPPASMTLAPRTDEVAPPPKVTPPPPRRREPTPWLRHALSLIVVALLVVVVAGSLVRAGVLQLGSFASPGAAEPAAPFGIDSGYAGVFPISLRAIIYPTQSGEQALVLMGEVESFADQARGDLEVLINVGGSVHSEPLAQRAQLGLSVSAAELARLTSAQDAAALLAGKLAARGGFVLPPGARASYVAVIFPAPAAPATLDYRASVVVAAVEAPRPAPAQPIEPAAPAVAPTPTPVAPATPAPAASAAPAGLNPEPSDSGAALDSDARVKRKAKAKARTKKRRPDEGGEPASAPPPPEAGPTE